MFSYRLGIKTQIWMVCKTLFLLIIELVGIIFTCRLQVCFDVFWMIALSNGYVLNAIMHYGINWIENMLIYIVVNWGNCCRPRKSTAILRTTEQAKYQINKSINYGLQDVSSCIDITVIASKELGLWFNTIS